MNRAFLLLPCVLCALILLNCSHSTDAQVAVLFAPPAEYYRAGAPNDMGINLWRENPDHWILLEVVSAQQGHALINNIGMVALSGLMTDVRFKGSPRSVTVCGHQSGTLQEIYGRSSAGRKLQGAEVAARIGVWLYVATYVHPANEPPDPRAEKVILNVCKNPKSNRSFSSKLPEGP